MPDLSDLASPLDVGGVRLRNRVFLAPMSGITDEPFRRRAFAHGAGLVVSEMIASGELAKGRAGSSLRLRHPGTGVHMVQLAGREAWAMAEGARIAAGEGAEIIDINMGCPAKKVTGGYAGSALMRDLDHAVSLIDAVAGAVAVPVTVKMRLGWDDGTLNAPALAARAEQAGARMITVHGRTRCQFYGGSADWRAIARVKAAVSVPVVANGDVLGPAEAAQALRLSGADAVMVGRASYGAPWAAGEIAAAAARRRPPRDGALPDPPPLSGEGSGLGVSPAGAFPTPEGAEIADYVVAHYADMLSLYGVESGLRQARKHLGWYLDRHAPGAPPALRRAMLTATEPRAVTEAVRQAFAAAEPPARLVA